MEKRVDKRGIGLVIDNINVMKLPWAKNSRPGTEGKMMNGMAGFLFEMRVKPGALDPVKFSEAQKKKGRGALKVDTITRKLNANGNRELLYLAVHLLSDLIINIDELSDLESYLPGLAKLLDIEPLELKPTKTVPVPTMARDESKTQEIKGIIDDLMGWLGLPPEQLEQMVIIVAGDQMTVDRMRRAHRYLKSDVDSSLFEKRAFILPLVGWWHQKWAAQKVRHLL